MRFGAITPRRFMMACEAGGGSSQPRRVLRPNLELIVKLRSGALAGLRPQEIKRIGVIDDEAPLVSLVQRYFKDISPVEEICDPQRFNNEPDLLKRLGFDAVFIDHDMPNITGSKIIEIARAQGFEGFLFGMTGILAENMPKFYKAGADLVLAKPFEIKLSELFTD